MQFVLLVCQMLKYERKSRGQNLGKKVSFREKFDVAVARAVAEMRILGGSKKCREVTPIDGRISIATALRGTSCFTMASSMPVVRASLLMTAIDLSIQLFKFFVSLYTQNPHASTSSKKK
ncbi:uncharacterized protein LOC127904352 [Populus trichocarpa]|uniref:uncharacterized protein LOC127904352 n=1 Tax=Populus trichocarpa TaxID=3694 RepID=UPI002279DA79|nr:uncharacterized protein LOC127904352 [Populus trichocarpa]